MKGKIIFPWMAPVHKAERALHNYKMKNRIDRSIILEGEKLIQVVVYNSNKPTMIYSTANTRSSYRVAK